MPRESKIPPTERRQWLADWERGERIDKIAKQFGRNERTVSAQINIARKEREQYEVRTALLKEAYQKHHAELVGVAKALQNAAERPTPGGLGLGERPLSFVGGMQHPMDGPVTTYRTQILQAALRQHMPKSPVWRMCKEWETAASELDTAQKRVRSTVAKMIEQRVLPGFPEVRTESFCEGLETAVQRTAEGIGFADRKYSDGRIDTGFVLRWGGSDLADKVPSEQKIASLQDLHEQLVQELTKSELVKRLKNAQDQWAGARNALWQETAMLELRGLLPGQCDLCPGTETNRRRKSPRRKETIE